MYQIFAINFSKQSMYENIGVGRICTFLNKRQVRTKVTYLYQSDGVEKEIQKVDFSNRYFGFSFLYCYADFIFAMCKKIKSINKDAVIFLGGRSVTDAFEQIFEDCSDFDVAILGHGENPTYDCIMSLEKGISLSEIAKLNPHLATAVCQKNKFECYEDINVLEVPERKYVKDNLTTASICTSHGCIGHCTFCSWKSTGKKWTGRSMKDVYDEIISIYETTGVRDFTFNDGSFEDPGKLGKYRIEELCELLENYPMKFAFRFYMRAETFKEKDSDIELLKRMRRNGFITAFVGIESGCNKDLEIYRKRAKVEDNIRIIRLLAKADIELLYGFIMMNPYSSKYTLNCNYNFLKQNGCYHLFSYVNVLDVFYNTEIYNMVKRDGLLLPSYRYNRTTEYINYYSDTEQIKQFLHKYFNDNTQIMRNYWEFYNFVNYFHFIKIICNNIYIDFLAEFEEERYKLCNLLSKYFAYLFVDFDIDSSRKILPLFETNINEIYHRVRNLKLRIMKKMQKAGML